MIDFAMILLLWYFALLGVFGLALVVCALVILFGGAVK